jgi:hypothetical protein
LAKAGIILTRAYRMWQFDRLKKTRRQMMNWWRRHVSDDFPYPAKCWDCNAGDCGGCATAIRSRKVNTIFKYKGDRYSVVYYIDPTNTLADVKAVYLIGRRKPEPLMIKVENPDLAEELREHLETVVLRGL